MSAQDKIKIYRGVDAPTLAQVGCMSIIPATPLQRSGLDKMQAAGFHDGGETRVLINQPGFSLTHVWFKKDYPLPLHSHDADCLYYVIAGSLQMGVETLGPKDCFFVPANAAYAYRPGPDGVELLEFRHATAFDFRNLAKNEAFYDKAAETIARNHDDWLTAKRPTELV
jgi:mannose-6-phosphate isomerase-like protein (cupin superfamily)